MKSGKTILVGDNPFQGVSHLSQERAKSRGKNLTGADYAADLVTTSIENGADGFMFTVNETSLSILQVIKNRQGNNQMQLYALVPGAYQLVRATGLKGGVAGLAKNMAMEIAFSVNLTAIMNGVKGVITINPATLLRSYLSYEVSRVKSASGKKATLVSMLLHEIVTDMALALNMDWVFKAHMDFMRGLKMKPGFETRNFSYLVKKFEEWDMDFSEVIIAAPFNAIGFQMPPSREEWETALQRHPEANVIAFSILAAGYLKLLEAAEYIANLPILSGVCVGISKEQHAHETFKLLKEKLDTN